jgi:protein tyrosine/serine phosphatase
MKNFFRSYVSAFVILLSLTAINLAQTAPSKTFPNVKIKNFGQMDENFFRGAQPKKDDYQSLKDLGVKTVVDLQDSPTDYEKAEVEALGMKYVNIPMDDKSYPKQENIDAFLKLANDPETGIFYVHCAGGRHRTGVAGAVYRFTKYGWDYDQVYKEMKNYDFYTRWGHGDMKDYVVDYAAKMKTEHIAAAANQNAAQGSR